MATDLHVPSLDITFADAGEMAASFDAVVKEARNEGVFVSVSVDRETKAINPPTVVNARANDLQAAIDASNASLARIEALVVLAEEAAEVTKAATKAIRFGSNSVNVLRPQDGSNAEQLGAELVDLTAAALIATVIDPTFENVVSKIIDGDSDTDIVISGATKIAKNSTYIRDNKAVKELLA